MYILAIPLFFYGIICGPLLGSFTVRKKKKRKKKTLGTLLIACCFECESNTK